MQEELFHAQDGMLDAYLAELRPPLELAQIRPAMPARMLHQSGIKWKVLVISACYSGGFIEALKDDNTLIITATDAHNQSCGCGNGRNLTWFGKAYFDDALRRTRSFTDAFGLARTEVAERERKRGFIPSNPQMYVGTAMREKLRGMAARPAGGNRGGGRSRCRPVKLRPDCRRQAVRALPDFAPPISRGTALCPLPEAGSLHSAARAGSRMPRPR